MQLIDSHAHLNDPRFSPDRPEVLQRAREAGIRGFVNVGFDLPSSLLAVALAEREPDCWAAVGVHPHDADEVTPDTVAQLRELAADPKVIAIGESGLDYFRNLSPPEVQREVFAGFIHLAADLGLPLIVHCREAPKDCLRVLDAHRAPEQRIIMHCFAGGTDFAEECTARGFWLGLAGTVTYPKSHVLREVAATVPAAQFLVETDCPWLPPQGHRGERNEPAYVAQVAAVVARERGLTPEQVSALTLANTQAAFNHKLL